MSLDEAVVATLMADADKGARLTVDLETQGITRPDGQVVPFTLEPDVRETLLEGADEISRTMTSIGEIWAFEEAHRQRHPWV